MKRLLTFIIIGTVLTTTGCQANLISQSHADDTVSNVAYHNQYVENINAVIAKAEQTISNYKQAQLDEETQVGKINQDLQALLEQVKSSNDTLLNLEPRQPIENDTYKNTFKNDYLKAINNYVEVYQDWSNDIDENTEKSEIQSDQLEQMYSKFIQSHNYFVEIINGQI